MAKGSWDELLKLINRYLRKNQDKEGVLKLLTRKEIGDMPAIGIRFRNPINETQYSLANKGMTRDRQYYLFKTYEKDIFDDIMKILNKVDDQGIKLGREQLKNLEYNVGVLKLLRNNNIKSADVLRKDGKNPSEVIKKQEKEGFVGEGGIMGSLEAQLKKLKVLAEEMDPKNIAKKEADEKALREIEFKKKYHGRAYTGRSDQYRGLSYQLAKLHEAGIIKLDDEIYKGIKEGKYHWAGAEFHTPDVPRVWRYHFGDEIFDKFDEVLGKFDDDTFIGPNAMVDWMKKNKIKPIKVEGPKNALDYLDETELIAHADEAQRAVDIYKGDDHFYSDIKGMSDKLKAENAMRAIVDNAENKKKYLEVLEKNYPEAYNKMDWKTAVDESHPAYKKDEIPNIQEAFEKEAYKVLSPGDEGYDEVMKKFTDKFAKDEPDNVIQGPWKKKTRTKEELIEKIRGLDENIAGKDIKKFGGKKYDKIDISKLSDKDLNKLVDELNMNQGKMAEVDSTGGTRMGYEEFMQLEKRNDEIQRALDRAKKMYEDLGEGTGNFQYDYATWMQKFGAKQKPGSYSISDQVLFIKSLKPIDAMKEANKVLKGTGRYKGLSKADQDKIIKDTEDHIFERDKPMHSDDIDPDDFDDSSYAEGGRVGLSEGTQPYTKEMFKKDTDLYIQAVFGVSKDSRPLFRKKGNEIVKKAIKEGVVSEEEAIEWVQGRVKLYKTLIDESKRQERTLGQEIRGVPGFSLPTSYGVEPDINKYYEDKKSQGGRVGFDGGGSPTQRLRQMIVDDMMYKTGVSEDKLQLIVKEITIDMSPDQIQASVIANFKKHFGSYAKGGRVGYSQGSGKNPDWGHGSVLDPEWDEGFDMEDTLRLLKQDQSGNQAFSASGNLDDLLQRLRMVVEGLGIYSDYNQNQRKQMQRSLTSQINVLLQN